MVRRINKYMKPSSIKADCQAHFSLRPISQRARRLTGINFPLATLLFMFLAGQTWAAPGITSITPDQAVGATQTATISVSGSGSLLTYQWQRNGVKLTDNGRIVGTQTSTLTIGTVSTNDTGSYTVTVTNASGLTTGGPSMLTVVLPPVVSAITNLIANGTNVVFSATVTPVEATYQAAYYWNKEGVDLSDNSHIHGAFTTNLTILNANSSDTGSYQIAVFNLAGVATNNPDLGAGAVFAAPVIAHATGDQTAAIGVPVNFNATISAGTGPLAYQWRANFGNLTNGAGISGATTASLTITAAGSANYDVVVSNIGGQAVSTPAHLTIATSPTPPKLTLQFSTNYPQLKLYGMVGSNYVVHYSTNLAGTNWIPLLSVTNLASSPTQFLDPAGIVPPVRFYRAIMQ